MRAPEGELDRVKAFVREEWSGLYRTDFEREEAGGRYYRSRLHAPEGPIVFTVVRPDGTMEDLTR